MLREANVKRLHWADKTMSLLRQQQLEACEKRLTALPDFNLYTYDDSLRVEELWQVSFDGQEHPRMSRLHTTQELRALVLTRLPAESLVRRMWCSITHEENRFVLHMPHALLTPLTMVLSSRKHEELRVRLMHHDAVIRALLYIGGLLHYEEPLYHLLEDVLEGGGEGERTLAMRYLRSAYDYTYDQDGEMLLLHPGLAEPEQLLGCTAPREGISIDLDEETIRGAMEGLMPEERLLFEQLYGLLLGATRPEIIEEEAVEDLRMLAKQGVPLAVMQEVLSTMLTIQPTQEMLAAVAELHRLTPRWGDMRMTSLQ